MPDPTDEDEKPSEVLPAVVDEDPRVSRAPILFLLAPMWLLAKDRLHAGPTSGRVSL